MRINNKIHTLPGRHLALLLGCALFLVSACNNIPNHVRYVPKDAIAVVGINAKKLGKKVAWSALTGSKLFKQMMERMPDKGAKDTANMLASAGIDIANTFYVYVKGSSHAANGNRATAIIPLSSAADWENFVKKSFPQAAIKQQNGRKEVNLTKGMYAGWNNKVLILIDILPNASRDGYNSMMGDSTANNAAPQPATADDTMLAAEMQNAFTISKDNSLYENKRFAQLQQDDHDITFWVNYDQLMTDFGSDGISGMMGGLSLSNSLWKDAAFAGGFDFTKGHITGDMLYYAPDSLKDICKELGATNADKEMIDRLPAQNMDMLFAMHLSPKGLKDMLEKMGVSGLANIAVSQKGLSTDDIFDAFTGDMAFLINDFTVKNQPSAFDSMMGRSNSYKANMDALYVTKINKRESFNKLMQLITENALNLGNNTYCIPVSDKDSVFIMTNDKYAAVSNKLPCVSSFMQGSNNGKLPAAAAPVYGHPFGMYFDIQQIVKTIEPPMGNTPNDTLIIAEGKKLIDNTTLTGGNFKEDAFEYHLSVNFMDKDENSLIQLMNFAMKVNDAKTQ